MSTVAIVWNLEVTGIQFALYIVHFLLQILTFYFACHGYWHWLAATLISLQISYHFDSTSHQQVEQACMDCKQCSFLQLPTPSPPTHEHLSWWHWLVQNTWSLSNLSGLIHAGCLSLMQFDAVVQIMFLIVICKYNGW